MKQVLFPGSFDPPTLGHLDIIFRASSLFDFVWVGVGINSEKKALFTQEERVALLKHLTTSLSNVKVVTFHGLLVDFVKENGIDAILKSFRSSEDLNHELSQAQMNRQLSGIETLYLVADEKYRFIRSSLVREIARHGKRLNPFVPSEIEETVFQRLSK